MEKEIWKDIKDYEGVYQVSNFGRVRSLDRLVSNGKAQYYKPGIIQKIQDNGNGYKYKQLKYKGTKRNFYIHRLVMETFVGPRPEGYHICHKDNDVTNNRLDNLRYDTPEQNNIDQFRHSKDRNGNCISLDDVLKIRRLYETGKYSGIKIADMLNVSKHNIYRIINRTNYAWLNDDGSIQESETEIKHK